MAKDAMGRTDEAERALDSTAHNLAEASDRLQRMLDFTKLVHEAHEGRHRPPAPAPGRHD